MSRPLGAKVLVTDEGKCSDVIVAPGEDLAVAAAVLPVLPVRRAGSAPCSG